MLNIPIPKSIIFGVSGTSLTNEEKEAYKAINPLGFILFKKNLKTKDQSKKLCSDLRKILGRNNAPILIDQEGGAVSRLKYPIWRESISPLELGKFAYTNITNSLERTATLVNLNSQLIAYEMQEIGINFNCAPVADLLISGAHSITSSRSFGPDKNITTILVNNMINGMKKCGVHAIIKHMLGQGRAKLDSHLTLPIISDNLKTLEENDFSVFKNAKDVDWGMTAHIIYNDIDPIEPVTYSKKSIDYIRNILGFKGVLISDCLTMKALPEELGVKASKTINAGVDLVLYGGSNLDHLIDISQNTPNLTTESFSKIINNLNNTNNFQNIDYKKTLEEYNNLFEAMKNELLSLPKDSFSLDLKLILQTIKERERLNADYSSPLYKA